MTGQGYIDCIHSKHAGRTGAIRLADRVALNRSPVLFPMPGVSERCVAPAQLSIGAKLHHASAFADRRSKPDGIFAASDQLMRSREPFPFAFSPLFWQS